LTFVCYISLLYPFPLSYSSHSHRNTKQPLDKNEPAGYEASGSRVPAPPLLCDLGLTTLFLWFSVFPYTMRCIQLDKHRDNLT
jgi:hypothetical protein